MYWVQFFKILYCIGIVLYWPNTLKNCIVYCIDKENAKLPGLGRVSGPNILHTKQQKNCEHFLQFNTSISILLNEYLITLISVFMKMRKQ